MLSRGNKTKPSETSSSHNCVNTEFGGNVSKNCQWLHYRRGWWEVCSAGRLFVEELNEWHNDCPRWGDMYSKRTMSIWTILSGYPSNSWQELSHKTAWWCSRNITSLKLLVFILCRPWMCTISWQSSQVVVEVFQSGTMWWPEIAASEAMLLVWLKKWNNNK